MAHLQTTILFGTQIRRNIDWAAVKRRDQGVRGLGLWSGQLRGTLSLSMTIYLQSIRSL